MSPAADVKTLVIDGVNVSARGDQTVLEVARENNIPIPTLCHLDGLTDVGACRMCLVEVKNSPKLSPSCVLKVEEGMEVTTNSPRLQHYRQTILELLFAERNHICSVCVANGNCELRRSPTHKGSPTCACRTGIQSSRSMPRTSALSPTPTAASSALAAYASAQRSRGRMCGT